MNRLGEDRDSLSGRPTNRHREVPPDKRRCRLESSPAIPRQITGHNWTYQAESVQTIVVDWLRPKIIPIRARARPEQVALPVATFPLKHTPRESLCCTKDPCEHDSAMALQNVAGDDTSPKEKRG
jgi:hypothetical protein